MFEKEAEDKSFEKYPIPKDFKELDLERNLKYEEGFKEGAEFGYKQGQSDQLVHKQYQLNQLRKANEWHYPSKGEYPKDDKDMLMSKTLLLITKMKGSDCLSLALGQYNFSTQEFSYQHIVGLTDVIAWKEIVLPELKESE